MQLQILPQTFAVCQIQDTSQINWQMPLFFFSKTAEELSLVCPETDYNTDYILIKESHLQKAAAALRTNGYQITA